LRGGGEDIFRRIEKYISKKVLPSYLVIKMAEIAKVSSKGQIVIPFDIRKELDLKTGATLVVSKMDDIVLLKKVKIPDPKEEFKKLTKWGQKWAKKKGIKEEDIVKIIHKGRGIKVA